MVGEAGEGVLALGMSAAISGAPETHASLLAGEVAAAASYRRRAKAANTVRACASDWRQFETWCDERGLEPLPARPEATSLAVLARAGRADSTIGRHLAAIGWQHRQCGLVPPTARDEWKVIADTLAGIRREARARPSSKKAAIAAADLAAMIATVRGIGSKAVRDRAILALGMASALRRSDLVALQLADVQLVEQGARITIRSSKTDQKGEEQVIANPNGTTILPVARLKAWLAVRGGAPGPLFTRFAARGDLTELPMSDRAIARLVQKYAGLAGLDASGLGAHSLRAGFLTAAARSGASLPKMQEVSRSAENSCIAEALSACFLRLYRNATRETYQYGLPCDPAVCDALRVPWVGRHDKSASPACDLDMSEGPAVDTLRREFRSRASDSRHEKAGSLHVTNWPRLLLVSA